MTEPELLARTEQHLASRLFDWRGLSFTKRYENPRLLQFIQTQPCLIPDCTGKSTVSHSTGKGRGGNNASDALALHLCLKHHTEFEDTPLFEDFERKYKIDLFKALIRLHERYMDYCEGLITGEIVIVEHRKHHKSVRKNRGPLSKACNTPEDFSKYQPKEL